ncbi:hypothetical protein [Methylobacterium sp. P5_C11]
MLAKRSQGDGETESSTGAGQALMMGEAVAGVFEEHGGALKGLRLEMLAHGLARFVQPLLSTCTTADWIKAINARLDLLEGDTVKPRPRLVQFEANGVAEMTAPVR